MIAGRALVLARAVALASTALAVSAGAHVIGGGHHVSPPLSAVLGILLLAAALPMARARLSLARLGGWTVAAQAGVHLALTWAHPTDAVQLQVAGHHGVQTAAGSVGASPHPASMLLAHVIGTAVTVLLLVALDRAAIALGRRWATILADPMPLPAARSAIPRATPRVRPLLALTASPRRGPPLAA